MFVKFEFKNYSSTLNLEKITSIRCNYELCQIAFWFNEDSNPYGFNFKDKESLNKVYNSIFNSRNIENYLLIVSEKDGLEEYKLKK